MEGGGRSIIGVLLNVLTAYLLLLAPLMLCVLILYKKLFMAVVFTLGVFARKLFKESCRRNNFLNFVVISDLGFEPWPYIY